MERIARIENFENDYDKGTVILSELEKSLEQMEEFHETMQQLLDYYGSETWHEDMEMADSGKLPKSLKCGVLTEDALWEMYGQRRELAIRMMELGLKILR